MPGLWTGQVGLLKSKIGWMVQLRRFGVIWVSVLLPKDVMNLKIKFRVDMSPQKPLMFWIMHNKGLYINEFYDLVFNRVFNLEFNIQASVFWNELVTVVVLTLLSRITYPDMRMLVTYHRWQFLILEIELKSWWNVVDVGDRRWCNQRFHHPHQLINSEYQVKLMNDRKWPRKVAVEKSPIMIIGSRLFWKSRMFDCKSFDWASAILTSFNLNR